MYWFGGVFRKVLLSSLNLCLKKGSLEMHRFLTGRLRQRISRKWYSSLSLHVYGSHGGSLFCTGIEFDAQDLSSFPQELSWTHRIWVRFHRNWVGPTGFEFVSPGIELDAQDLSSFLVQLTGFQFDAQNLRPGTENLWAELDSCGNELKSCCAKLKICDLDSCAKKWASVFSIAKVIEGCT